MEDINPTYISTLNLNGLCTLTQDRDGKTGLKIDHTVYSL